MTVLGSARLGPSLFLALLAALLCGAKADV